MFLITFIILSIINVTFSTVRTLLTIKGGKLIASLMNGGYFAFYNIMLIYTVADFPLWQKCTITFICNVIGVFSVKLLEESLQKDKLWKIETTIPKRYQDDLCEMLSDVKISYNYIEGIGKYTIFNIFCDTKEKSAAVKEILKVYRAKYFVGESKIL